MGVHGVAPCQYGAWSSGSRWSAGLPDTPWPSTILPDSAFPSVWQPESDVTQKVSGASSDTAQNHRPQGRAAVRGTPETCRHAESAAPRAIGRLLDPPTGASYKDAELTSGTTLGSKPSESLHPPQAQVNSSNIVRSCRHRTREHRTRQCQDSHPRT